MMRQKQLPSWVISTEPVSNRQFCRINAPFKPLTIPPSCITALYAKNDQAIKEQCSLAISHAPCTFVPIAVTSNLWIILSNPQTLASAMTIIYPEKANSTVSLQQPFHILMLSLAWSATSRYFHLLPHYKDHTIMMNVSLDTANINAINISTLDFRIWQHFSSNWSPSHLQKLANVPEVPVTQLYKDMINTNELTHLFTIKDEDKDPSLIWTILLQPGDNWYGYCCMYRFYCFERFWIRPATSRHQLYSPVSL